MKNLLSLRASVLLLALTLLFAAAHVATALALGTPADPPGGSTFDQRLAQRKAEQQEQLDDKTAKHVQSVCATEQSAVRQMQPKATSVANNRTATYQKIDGILLISIGQLKLTSQDTFKLEQNRAALVQKITAFQDTFANYQQTLGDILVINCQADPTGFQALLDTARAYYTQLSTESGDIASYVKNTIQPAMQDFANRLQLKSDDGNS